MTDPFDFLDQAPDTQDPFEFLNEAITPEKQQRWIEEERRREEERARLEEERRREEEQQRDGEGLTGIGGDILAGAAGGTLRAAEAINRTAQWFIPGEAEALGQGADYWQGIREDNPDLFGESRANQMAREGSAWNPRGWLHGGFESLTMMTPGLVIGAVNPVAGLAVTSTQFWGDTAQQYYDDAIANEKQGLGEKLSETEKVAYANLRGFVEGGLEAVQQYIPFGKLGKILPKTKVDNLVRGAVLGVEGGIGKKALASAKSLAKVIAAESAMEVGQEYGGQKIDFVSGQSTVDPTWDTVKAVIGPTIIMSTVLGFAGQAQESGNRKALHEALTSPNATPQQRMGAVMAVYRTVAEQDQELADLWKAQTAESLQANKPVALPIDSEIRAPQEKPAPTTPTELKESLQADVAELSAQVEAKEARLEQDLLKQQETDRLQRLVKTLESSKYPEGSEVWTKQQAALTDAKAQLAVLTGTAEQQVAPAAATEQQVAPTTEPIIATAVDGAAHATAAESPLNDLPTPTGPQKSAGNYAVGHTKIGGLEISIENPQGSVRKGTDATGRAWEQPLAAHYGYVRRVQNGPDGDKLDVFVKSGTEETFDGPVFVVNQMKTDGTFDEHKAIVGVASAEEAAALYDSNYEAGWQGRGEVVPMSLDEFKTWAKQGNLAVPAIDVKTKVAERDLYSQLLNCVKGL